MIPTRSEVFARLLRGSRRRNIDTLDKLYRDKWIQVLSDLADLQLIRFSVTRRGRVRVYVLKQTRGRSR